MIVSFSIENWMSFRGPVTFSMAASLEKQHAARIPRVKKYSARILPIAAIYGGNASGKTNFFKALRFVQNLVVRGVQPDGMIPVEPFRLDTTVNERPSRFSLELLINETIFEFSFSATRKAIVEEKLVEILSTREKVLYHRADGKVVFDDSLSKDMFLEFAFTGTRDNQLFLTNTVSQKGELFRPVYDWFKDTLELVAPDSRFAPFEQFLDESSALYATMNELLPLLDTGISHLGSEDIPFDQISLPDSLRTKIEEDVSDGESVHLLRESLNDRYVITRKDGELFAKKLITFHPNEAGSRVKFDMRNESDGSQRVIDLLPSFLMLSEKASHRVIVIDEVDRSLHSLLTRRLLETFLASCSPESRSQLLITTHDVLLMDQKLLRRDEMWVMERESSGSTNLFSIGDFKEVRNDKDIRKSYLQGRLGGIPRLLVSDLLSTSCGTGNTDGGH